MLDIARRHSRFVCALLVVAALGCSGGGSKTSTSSSSGSSAVDTSSRSSSSDTGDSAETLQAVAISAADLPAGTSLRLVSGGDQVSGQVTLDMCGADFPSEALRTDRLQQIAKDATGVTVVNNENVLYRDSAAAASALNEVRSAVAGCPSDQFKTSHVHGVPPLKYQLQIIPDDQLGPIGDDHVAITAVLTSEDGKSLNMVIIYQRRGRLLAAVNGPSLDAVSPFAHIVATRIGALSAAQVGE